MSNPQDVGSNLLQQLIARQIQQKNPLAFQSHLFRERLRLAKNLYKFDLVGHYGCVNAIEFSNGGQFLASGGDDKRILIWNVEKAIAGIEKPRVLDSEHTSNVFCLGFDRFNEKIFSGGNDDLVIIHDNETGKLHNVFKHDKPVYGLSIDPTCDSIFATACEDGHIQVFDQRNDPADPLVVAKYRASFHAVQFHPLSGHFLVTANSRRGAAFWDLRNPQIPVIHYGADVNHPSYMSVRFNSFGNLILALRRRLPPILYHTFTPEPICQFYSEDYYNSCTMKSCTFAGEDDELVLSGSDDFNLYVWRVSDVDLEKNNQWIDKTKMVLFGHRSIVNQVRYNREKCLLASSGVEKIVKLWSPFNQRNWTGSLLEEATGSDNPRDLFSPYTFPAFAPQTWSHMPHDYSSRNTNEDPRMMAFFDSLIQQEIEGWDTIEITETDTSSSTSSNGINNRSTDDTRDRQLIKYLLRKRERQHRNAILGNHMNQRHKYANRIAYLIASKRNTLRRLALEGPSNCNLRSRRIRTPGRAGVSRASTSNGRSLHSSTRNGRGNYSYHDRSQGPSSSGLCNFPTNRRKHKQKRIPSNVSSSDDDDEIVRLPTNLFNAPIPSTSTGITSSGKGAILRLRQQQRLFWDSDEDDDDDDDSSRVHAPSTYGNSQSTIRPPRPGMKVNGHGQGHDETDEDEDDDDDNDSHRRPTPPIYIPRKLTISVPINGHGQDPDETDEGEDDDGNDSNQRHSPRTRRLTNRPPRPGITINARGQSHDESDEYENVIDNDSDRRRSPPTYGTRKLTIPRPRPLCEVKFREQRHDDSSESPTQIQTHNSLRRRRKAERDIYSSHSNSRQDDSSSPSTSSDQHFFNKRSKYTSDGDDETQTTTRLTDIPNEPNNSINMIESETAGPSSSVTTRNEDNKNTPGTKTQDSQPSHQMQDNLTPDTGPSTTTGTSHCRAPCDTSHGGYARSSDNACSSTNNEQDSIPNLRISISGVRRSFLRKFVDDSDSD